VRNLTSYGAFIEIEEGIDGLLHVSDMSWTRKVSHPSEIVKKGDTVETVVLEVDSDKRRLALGLKQLLTDPWQTDIPKRYHAGDLARGVVSKLTSFGAFVELEDGLEGLLHISELSDKKISSPEEILAVGDVVDVRVIRVDSEARKIGLSLRAETGVEGAEGGPRLVMRSEEIGATENPSEIVQEALKEAPQRLEPAPPQPVERGSELGISLELAAGGEADQGETAAPPEPAAVPEESAEAPAQEPGEAAAVPTEPPGPTEELAEAPAEPATVPEESTEAPAQEPAEAAAVPTEPAGPTEELAETLGEPESVSDAEEVAEPSEEDAPVVELREEAPSPVELDESNEEEEPPPPPPPPPA